MGPFGALAIMATILYGIYRFVNDHAVPLAKQYVDNQQSAMKEILTEHAKTRDIFSSAITSLVGRIDRVEVSIENIQDDLTFIRERNVGP